MSVERYRSDLKIRLLARWQLAEGMVDALEWDNYRLLNRRRATVRAVRGLRKQHQLDQDYIDHLEAIIARLERDGDKPRFGL